jgi:hypothetical protein
MPSHLTKQLQFLPTWKFNSGSGDSAIGGTLASLPSGIASQYDDTQLGDRIVLGAADALALSDTAGVGTLYGGIYMYVGTPSGSTVTPTINRLAFLYPTDYSIATSAWPGLDSLHVVTPDELQAGSGFPGIVAGVFINTLTKGNWWWIQIAGKTTCLYGANSGLQFAGTPTYAVNQGVYAGGYGNTAGAGLVTPIVGGTFPTTYAILDRIRKSYIGIAETGASASAVVTVDMEWRLPRL